MPMIHQDMEPMQNVDINLGWACNNNCLFCSNGQATSAQRKWGDENEIRSEIVARRTQGALSIGFLGGEPTIYPKILEMVALAKKEGYNRISICTNGRKLSKADFLQDLIDAGLTRVALSIHSHTATLEDRITGRKGSFSQKMMAISNLVKVRDQGFLPDGFSLNVVMHGKNIKDLVEFSRYMAGKGVNDIRFNLIRPAYKVLKSRVWVPAFKTVTPNIMSAMTENEARLSLTMTFADVPLCKLPWQVLANPHLMERYIGENWDLATEVTQHRPAQDPDQSTNRFNWKVQRQEKLKSFPETCETCPLMGKECEGVWSGYLDVYGNSEFAGSSAMVQACIMK